MVNINISLRKEAYDFLNSLKTKNKSFSEVILDFKKDKYEKGNAKSLLRFAGILKNVDWEEREKEMKALRKDFDKRIERLKNDRTRYYSNN